MKIYEPREKQFNNNGLGTIKPLKCIEKKDRSLDGWCIEVTVSIEYQDMIKQDYIAFVETKEKSGQPFRINNISLKNRIIAFTANHIVFDSERYLLDDVRPTDQTALSFLNYVNERTDTHSPYYVTSDISDRGTSYFVRKTLLDAFMTAEEIFGGVYDIDGFNIALKNHVGNDNGVCVIYGKNIEDMNVNEDWNDVCTKILPEGTNGILLPEKYLLADVQYEQPFTRTVKFDTETENNDGSKISEKEQIVELRKLAQAYLDEHIYPKISYVAKASPDDELCIGDIVHIKHPLCTLSAEVYSYTYDTIAKKVTEISFGNYKPTARRAVASIRNEIDKTDKRITTQEAMIQHQTDLINSQFKNGYVYVDDNEIFILDELPKEKAKNVWRFNMGGLGFSSNGWQGPYLSAWTIDGKFNADFITAGTIQGIELIGNTIKGGKIEGNTTIKVGTDLYVGDNIYLGDQKRNNSKRVFLNEKIYIGLYDFEGSSESGFVVEVGTAELLLTEKRFFVKIGDYIPFFADKETKDSLISGDLNVSGFLDVSKEVRAMGLDVTGHMYVSDEAHMGGNLLTFGDLSAYGEIYAYKDLSVNGNLFVQGKKNRIVKTEHYGMRKLNAVESAECYFTDEGQAVFDDDGKADIKFDPIWLETVSTDKPYHIQLTPYCEVCPWIVEEYADHCVIAGKPNTKVNWHISALQKDYDNVRLEEFIEKGDENDSRKH